MQPRYAVEQLRLRESGYVSLAYAARGWYLSNGTSTVAGEAEQKDVSAVIDFLLSQPWHVDPARVAMVGVSYGGGLALLGAGTDDRVRAVCCLSGWTDLTSAFFWQGSPNVVWMELLLAPGAPARLEPGLREKMDRLIHGDHASLEGFIRERSPGLNGALARAARRGVPILMSNNFEDQLFLSNDALRFTETYSGPRKALLNQGVHASAELGGLFGLQDTYVWKEVSAWLDMWLLGVQNGANKTRVTMQLQADGPSGPREVFSDWPNKRVVAQRNYPQPRGWRLYGHLALSPGSNATETLHFALFPGVSAGLPVVADPFQTYANIPITSALPVASRRANLVYLLPLPRTRMCGVPTLSLDVTRAVSMTMGKAGGG